MSGQLEEDVVEDRSTHRDVFDADSCLVEPPDGFSDLTPPAVERNPQGAVLEEGAPVGDRRERG